MLQGILIMMYFSNKKRSNTKGSVDNWNIDREILLELIHTQVVKLKSVPLEA